MTMACDSTRAVVGTCDGKVFIIDLHSGVIKQTIATHSPRVTGIRVSDHDDYLITGGIETSGNNPKYLNTEMENY